MEIPKGNKYIFKIFLETSNILSFCFRIFLTPVSMHTTHSELPGPSTGLGAEGVTGVPGVSGGLGIWMVAILERNGGEVGDGAVGMVSRTSSCGTALKAPVEEEN